MRGFLLVLVFICHYSISQSIHELRATLGSDDDSTRVASMGRLAAMYTRSNTDSAFYFGRFALSLAETLKLDAGKASANNALGNIHFFQSNYDSAIFHFNVCLRISEELHDSLRIGAMLNNIGTVLTYQTKYDTSLSVLFEARNIRQLIDDPKITSTVNNIGNAYQRMQDWEKALEYYQEAAELKEKYGQTLSLSNTLNNIGIVLKYMDRVREAVPYYERSLKIAEDFDDKHKQANAHNNLAAIYHLDADLYSLAEEHYRKSIALKEEMGDKVGMYNSYGNLADLLSEGGRDYEALRLIEKSENLQEEIGQNLFTSTITRMKASVLFRLGRTIEAYDALDRAYSVKTEEMALDRNEKIAELETKFETAKKEAEIERLGLENELKDANLAKSKNAQVAMGIGGGLTVILLIVFFTLRHKKQLAEREAQELQIDAMKKRFMELHASPAELSVSLDFIDLNEKLNTPLTEREFDSLRLSLEGKSNTEIAEVLFISVSTVKFHLRNTYSKMGVGNRKEAFQYMLKTS